MFSKFVILSVAKSSQSELLRSRRIPIVPEIIRAADGSSCDALGQVGNALPASRQCRNGRDLSTPHANSPRASACFAQDDNA